MSESIASIFATSSDTARMRLLAAEGDESVNAEVLQQFEALFLQQMLKSMRTASLGASIFQTDQTEFYRDMYDQQIATDLAQKELLGISGLINRQLGLGDEEVLQTPTVFTADTSANVSAANHYFRPTSTYSGGETNKEMEIANTGVNESKLLSEVDTTPYTNSRSANKIRPLAFKPDSPEDFVEYAYQFTKPVADRIGVSPDVIIAIAALETGWGEHLPTDSNGSSHNYFGIKADARWDGQQVKSDTLEFADGVFNKLQQSFRAYENLSESFNDFAEFILGNERYQKAVDFAHDTKRFLQEIQNAGYATDPKYADKVLNVLRNDAFAHIK